MTRNRFLKAVGSSAFSHMVSGASAGDPFTIAWLPDPQWLSGDASTIDGGGFAGRCTIKQYTRMFQWAINNKALSVNGTPLNIKGFACVGDLLNNSTDVTYGLQQQVTVAAGNLAEQNGMFYVRAVGNHEYTGGGFSANGMPKNLLCYFLRNDKNGVWSPNNLAAMYGAGINLGNADMAYWGGAYADPTYPVSTANHYMRVNISGMKILIIATEPFPRSSVMLWAKSIHDAYPDHQCWLIAHAYVDLYGAVSTPSSWMSTQHYLQGAAPVSNAGSEIWGGSDATWPAAIACKNWQNLTIIIGGHFIDGYNHVDYPGGWVWRYLKAKSASPRGQDVHQIFVNSQEADLVNSCPVGGLPDGTSDVAHLALMRVDPATQTMEMFYVSTNTGLWTGALDVRNNATPVQLFAGAIPSPPSQPARHRIGIQ